MQFPEYFLLFIAISFSLTNVLSQRLFLSIVSISCLRMCCRLENVIFPPNSKVAISTKDNDGISMLVWVLMEISQVFRSL